MYYFFVASLPSLYFGRKPSISVEDFLIDAERILPSKDYQRLKCVLEDCGEIPQETCSAFGRWMQFNHALRNEAAWARANRLRKDPLEFIRGARSGDVRAMQAVQKALEASNPLEATKALDHARWEFLEELTQGSFFDFTVVLAYALKLQMLQRYAEIESDEGLKKFEEYKEFKRVKEIIKC